MEMPVSAIHHVTKKTSNTSIDLHKPANGQVKLPLIVILEADQQSNSRSTETAISNTECANINSCKQRQNNLLMTERCLRLDRIGQTGSNLNNNANELKAAIERDHVKQQTEAASGSPRLELSNDRHNSKPAKKRRDSKSRLTKFLKMDTNVLRTSSHPDQLDNPEICGINARPPVGSRTRKYSLPHYLNDVNTFRGLRPKTQVLTDDEEVETGSVIHSIDDELLVSDRPSEFKLRDQLFSFFQASDNKLAMKLFGSRNALLKEKRRQLAAKSWIIHPCSNFRLYWDLLMLIFLITNLIVLPVSIAFFYDDIGVHWIVFNITCDTMFIVDIIVNFRTGLIDDESHGNVILDAKVIAKHYLKTWFVIDFLSSLPLDYVFLSLEGQSYSAGRALRILRLAKLLQLLRLLRISRLVRYVRLWQEFFSLASIVVRIFNLICIMVLVGHWSGCIQFFVPVVQGWPEDSWIALNNLQTVHWWDQYTRSLFKALSHMLCIGYGQFPPRNMTDTWLTIASMLAGATCYALFIGHATALIQSFDSSSRQFRDHLQQVNEYMIFRKLPMELRRRITDYYDHRFGGKLFDEAAILNEISESLRKDVIYHNCKQLIKNVPFFLNADNSFVADVISQLDFEMYQPGDVVIRVETKGEKMYFIQEGLVEIVGEDGRIVTRLADGSYFGEISLLTHQKRTASVRAVTYCNLFSLAKEHFDIILECYPVMRRTLETIAAQRLQCLGLDPSLVTSRESLLDDVYGIQSVFQGSIHEGDSSDDEDSHQNAHNHPKESQNPFLNVVKGFFTKDSENFPSASSRLGSFSMRNDLNNNSNCSSPISRCTSTVNHLLLTPTLGLSARRVQSSGDVQKLIRDVTEPMSNEESTPLIKRRPRSTVNLHTMHRKTPRKTAVSASCPYSSDEESSVVCESGMKEKVDFTIG